MTNLQTGGVTFQVGERTYTLKFSINALCTLEAELGAAEVIDIQAMIGERPSVTILRTLFWAGLQEAHPGTTKEQAGNIMGALGLVPATEKMTQALVAALGAIAQAGAAPLAVVAGTPAAPAATG